MAISLKSSGLRSSKLRDEDYDPISSVANISDAMLVLAVALMMALLSYWQMDIPVASEVLEEKELSEVSDIEETVSNMTGEGSSYTELGMVYQDPETGKMYMITEDLESSDSGME